MGTGEVIFIGFCSLAALNAVFFAVYKFLKRDKNVYAVTLLSLFMVITAFRITQMLLHDLQDDFGLGIQIKTIFFLIPTFPLTGPILYLYIRSVSTRDFHFRKIHLLHLIPFLLFLIIDLLNRKNFPLSLQNHRHYITYCIQITLILIQFLIYIGISFKISRELIRENTSGRLSKDNMYPFWIRNIIWAVSFLWLIFALYCIQTYFHVYLAGNVPEALYYSLLSYWILFHELKDQKITTLNNFSSRYKSSGLTPEDVIKYKTLIIDYVVHNEVYKDHTVTLGKLSKNLSLTPHLVSQVINEQLSSNFNDFINSYRVEEAKKMLADTERENFTIASIAYDSGFNTLSAFNVAFKKFTGVTPSQFRLKDK